MFKIVGYNHKKGEFTDESNRTVAYDYIAIHYVSNEMGGEGIKGLYAGTAKAKPEELKINGGKNLDEILDKEVILVPSLNNPKYLSKIVVL